MTSGVCVGMRYMYMCRWGIYGMMQLLVGVCSVVYNVSCLETVEE